MSRTLSTHEFVRQLKVLNPALRVCAFEGSSKLAGLHYIDKQGEYFDICGVDKGCVPEYTEWDHQGHMLVSGWRRVYLMLVQLGLTTAARVMKVCPGFYLHWSQADVDLDRKVSIYGDEVQHKMQKYGADKELLSNDEILDVAQDIRAKDAPAQQEQDEKNRWFLKTWAERGGNISDKPKI